MEISDKRQAGEDIGYLKGGVIIAQRLFSALMVPPVLVLFLFQRLPDRDQQLHLVLLQARLHCRSLQVLASPGFTILLTISNSFKKTLASRKSVSRVLSKVLSRALSGVTPWCHSLVSLSGVTQMSTVNILLMHLPHKSVSQQRYKFASIPSHNYNIELMISFNFWGEFHSGAQVCSNSSALGIPLFPLLPLLLPLLLLLLLLILLLLWARSCEASSTVPECSWVWLPTHPPLWWSVTLFASSPCKSNPSHSLPEFFSEFGSLGAKYECWVSHLDPDIAITELDLRRLKREVNAQL